MSFNLAPMVELVQWSYQLIGLYPYKFPTDINSDHFTVSMVTAIYSITLSTLSGLSLTFQALEDGYDNPSRSNLLNFTTRIMLIGGICYHIGYTLVTLLIRKKMWEFLKDISNIDKKLETLGVQLNYTRQNWFVQVFTAFWIGFAGVLFAMYLYDNLHAFCSISTFFVKIFSHIVAVLTYGASMSSFFLCLVLIYSRFVCLNIAFRHRLLQHEDVPKNLDDIVRNFRIIHDALTDSVSKVNSLLALMAMGGVTVTTVFSVLYISALYKKYMLGNDDHLESITYFNWVFYFIVMALLNVIMASMLLSEGKSTVILVHKAINRNSQASHIQHLRLFSQQLKVRSPIVTCWFYNFDWELIYSMLGIISMYTLIFIQFDILAAQNQRTN